MLVLVGTSAALVRSGVNEISCGVRLGQMMGVTGAVLGDAIKKYLEEESIIARAKETGTQLIAEDGCANFYLFLTY